MSMTNNTTRSTAGRGARFIAPLTPESPDPDARADATNPAVLAALEVGWRSTREPGGQISQEELLQELAPTKDELAAADAELDALEAEEEEAEQARQAGELRPRRRASGARPTVVNGTILLRVPLSVHRELIERAEAEQTSLNQLVLAYISRGLGQDAAGAPPPMGRGVAP
jgi:predicted HicB family RNase H-like nuclease